jgi:uroporphyrinogen-III synthase
VVRIFHPWSHLFHGTPPTRVLTVRLLVLRPEPNASETAARLREFGHSTLIEPMLTVELHPQPGDLPEPAAILFTSRNAVRALARWPRATGWRDRPAFAVGPETAAHARASGFADVRVGSRDVAALAELVAAVLPTAAGTVLYPAAPDRAGDLEVFVSSRGFSVHVAEAYRAVATAHLSPATVAALQHGEIDGVLVYSRRTAETFRDLARTAGIGQLHKVAFFALSESVAEPLRPLDPAEIRIASRPDGEAMLALLTAGR